MNNLKLINLIQYLKLKLFRLKIVDLKSQYIKLKSQYKISVFYFFLSSIIFVPIFIFVPLLERTIVRMHIFLNIYK